jgi:hypothetical protein
MAGIEVVLMQKDSGRLGSIMFSGPSKWPQWPGVGTSFGQANSTVLNGFGVFSLVSFMNNRYRYRYIGSQAQVATSLGGGHIPERGSYHAYMCVYVCIHRERGRERGKKISLSIPGKGGHLATWGYLSETNKKTGGRQVAGGWAVAGHLVR